MPGVFRPEDRNDLISRIQKLTPNSKPLWGKMSVAEMLAHCQRPILVSLGEMKLKQGLIGLLFGRMAKKQMMSPKPFKKNLPTVSEFKAVQNDGFDAEKTRLIHLIERFSGGPSVLTREPHPFFGRMTTEEWDVLQWKHLDHHLTQFGV
jgi:hypothetical protein